VAAVVALPRPGVAQGIDVGERPVGDATQDPELSPTEKLLAECEGRTVTEIRVGQMGEDGTTFLSLTGPPASSILSVLNTKTDQPLDGLTLQQDLRRLVAERSYASTVLVEKVDAGVILYLVILRADQVFDELRWKGVSAFTDVSLESILDIVPNQAVSWLQVQSMRNILLARYRREGYLYCSIEVSPDRPITEGNPFTARREFRSVTLRVDEGPQVTVRNVYFRGNKSFPGDVPITFMSAEEVLVSSDTQLKSTGRWAFAKGAPFSTEVIEEDLDRLRLFYRSHGFRDAEVTLASFVPLNERREVDVTFRIIEGERYIISGVDLERLDERGEPLDESEALYPKDAVMADFRVQVGDPYDADAVAADLREIQRFYGERGHPMGARLNDALRIPEPDEVVDPDRHEIRLIYQVIEGTPKRLRDVLIRGNTYTEDRVIRRKIFQGPGDQIDMPLIQKSARALQATGYFRDKVTQLGPRLTLEPAPDGEPDEVNLHADVVEGDTGQLRWGVGISTGAGVQASIMVNKYNFDFANLPSSANPFVFLPEVLDNKAFHGAGQSLNLLLAPGTDISQFFITFTEPDLFRQHQDTIGLRLTGARELRRFDSYFTDRLRASVSLSRNFTEEFSIALSLRQETIEVDNPDANAPTIVFDAEGQTELRGSKLSLNWEDLDNVLIPSDGFQFRTYGELVGGFHGGETNFWKSGVSLDHYSWFREDLQGRRHVIHLSSRFDVGGGFGQSEDLFLTDRLFMGGPNLRGFDFRGAGPSQFGRATGGEAMLLASGEYFFPLVASRQTGAFGSNELIRGVLFTDFGMLGTRLDTDDFAEPRWSAGFGVRINVPVLNIPIALDLGWPLAFEESDDRRQLYFSLSRQ